MATSRRFVQITDKEINKIKIIRVKIPKQLFAPGSVIFEEYSPLLRLGEYVRVKYREGGMYVMYNPRGRAASEGCI